MSGAVCAAELAPLRKPSLAGGLSYNIQPKTLPALMWCKLKRFGEMLQNLGHRLRRYSHCVCWNAGAKFPMTNTIVGPDQSEAFLKEPIEGKKCQPQTVLVDLRAFYVYVTQRFARFTCAWGTGQQTPS